MLKRFLACMGAVVFAAAFADAADITPSATQMPELSSEVQLDGSVVLATNFTVDEYTYVPAGLTLTQRLRGFNVAAGNPVHTSMQIGPVLRVQKGATLKVNIKNNLAANTASSYTMNTMHYPSTFNLHTHGIHVDADEPADNVLIKIEPTEEYEYTYVIEPDHMGGTHWYHAHVHGNTALQVGGGLVGMLIVEDSTVSEDEVPDYLHDLDEIPLVIQMYEPAELQTMAGEFDNNAGDGWTDSAGVQINNDDLFWIINGHYSPTIKIEANRWTRLRMVFSGLGVGIVGELAGDGCEWKLLAKDGIYVAMAPRTMTKLYLAPGMRADVLMRCSTVSTDVSITAANQETTGPNGGASYGTMLSFEVIENAGTEAGSTDALAYFTAKLPEYLYDLTSYTGAVVEHSFNLAGGPQLPGTCAINFDGTALQWDEAQAAGTVRASMALGSVQKWSISGVDKHPWHIHINSFQLSNDGSLATSTNDFFQPGDWHDVFFAPLADKPDTILFSVDNHQSTVVTHCHFLAHEDKGCMAIFGISGTEGTTTGLGSTACDGCDGSITVEPEQANSNSASTTMVTAAVFGTFVAFASLF